MKEGEFDRAVELFGDSLELNRQIGRVRGTTACLAAFAAINLARGNLEERDSDDAEKWWPEA